MVERRVIVGVFQGRAQAEKAVHDLEAVGLNEHQISFAIRQPDEQGEPKLNISNDQGASPVGKVPLTGAATGGVVGGVAGALTALFIAGVGQHNGPPAPEGCGENHGYRWRYSPEKSGRLPEIKRYGCAKSRLPCASLLFHMFRG